MKSFIQFALVITLGALVLLAAGCSRQQGDQATRDIGNVVEAAGDEASDASLTARVKAALIASDKVDSSRLDVDTEKGVVHLRGTVPSNDQKRMAEDIARNTVGSSVSIRNELRTGAAPATSEQDRSRQSAPTKPR